MIIYIRKFFLLFFFISYFTYNCFPADDVCMKANIIQRYINATVSQYFSLKSARIVDKQVFVVWQFELFFEVFIFLLVRIGESLYKNVFLLRIYFLSWIMRKSKTASTYAVPWSFWFFFRCSAAFGWTSCQTCARILLRQFAFLGTGWINVAALIRKRLLIGLIAAAIVVVVIVV